MQFFLAILIPLVIIMDPLGNLPLFLLFTENNSERERNGIALTATVAAGGILLFFCLSGDYILRFFHIGLPAFQLAGGFIFFLYALQMLRLIPGSIKTSLEEEEEGISKENAALVPLATPLLAGPGAITLVLIWRQDASFFRQMPVYVAAIAVSCLLIYLVFRYGTFIRRLLGVSGIRVITRLMGLLLAVIAVQFMVGGLEKIG